jgi:hypothetical protein
VTPIPALGPSLRIFIGYDSREPLAYHVLAHSILTRASVPVSITPLRLDSLKRLYTRERGPTESTEFSLTRFLVPHLSNYEGLSLFLDCDMVMQADVADLLLYPLADPGKAVYVCQHDYTPNEGACVCGHDGSRHATADHERLRFNCWDCGCQQFESAVDGTQLASNTKFLGQQQTTYPRKNWSSVMLFDNARCGALRPEYVNTATGLQLHRLQWVVDREIGSLPLAWNYLVGESNQATGEPKNIHFTNGGPWFPEYADCPFADRWLQALAQMHGQAVCA